MTAVVTWWPCPMSANEDGWMEAAALGGTHLIVVSGDKKGWKIHPHTHGKDISKKNLTSKYCTHHTHTWNHLEKVNPKLWSWDKNLNLFSILWDKEPVYSMKYIRPPGYIYMDGGELRGRAANCIPQGPTPLGKSPVPLLYSRSNGASRQKPRIFGVGLN